MDRHFLVFDKRIRQDRVGAMKIVTHRPRSLLREFVEVFWLRDNFTPAHDEEREAILPDGRAHLVINLSEDAVRIFHQVRNASVETLDGSVFCGPQSSPYAILPTASVVIGVHFRAGGAFPFLRIPAEEFHNARIPLDIIYGADARELRGRLIAATSPARKFAILEDFLLGRMLRPRVLHRAVLHGLRSFEARQSPAVAEVLRETGLSARRFSRVFSEQVGITPKLFQRVQRFQRTVAALPPTGEIDWASTALDAGYYDQAHFRSNSPTDGWNLAGAKVFRKCDSARKTFGNRSGCPTAIAVKKAYARAGVDVDLGNRLKRRIQALVGQTHGPEVLGKIGGFGGLFAPDFSGMREPVLVGSIDGVGTKLKIAFAMDRHDTIGADLVNHCINDIAVVGARPLFFLDYIGAEKLEPRVFQQILRGFSKACRAGGCALVGGETAQMPGMYRKGEYDLAGCIVGVVDRRQMIDGSNIKAGDMILGLASNGLHTNGYSLARKIFFEQLRLKTSSRIPGLRLSLGEELLRMHKNYQPLLAKVPNEKIKGLAHITGGGLVDNLPRILPDNCDAVIDTTSWKVPPIFQILEERGPIDRAEMYQVFNMGIGMVAVVGPNEEEAVAKMLDARRIGRIERGRGVVRFSSRRGRAT